MNRALAVALAVPLLTLGLAACTSDGQDVARDRGYGAPPRADLPSYEWGGQPSPVVLLLPGGDLDLRQWTSCWSSPPDAGGSETSNVSVSSPTSSRPSVTIPIAVSEARDLGFTPCARCGPDAMLAEKARKKKRKASWASRD
jgi:hypothetical protein